MAHFRYTGNYYVSPNGSDANNGTSPNTPFATIQAAIDAVGNTSSQTIVIGSGTYNESLSSPQTYNTNLYLTLQGDGEVIINGDGISQNDNTSLGNGSLQTIRSWTFNDITWANWIRCFHEGQNQNYFQYNYFNRCTFINIQQMYVGTTSNPIFYTNCTFIQTPFLINANTQIHQHVFRFCTFLKSPLGYNSQNEPTGYYNLGSNSYNNNTRWNTLQDCIFANPFDDEPTLALTIPIFNSGSSVTNPSQTFQNIVFDDNSIIQRVRYSTTDSSVLNYTQSAAEFVSEINQYGTWLDGSGSNAGPAFNTANVVPNTILNYDLSFNSSALTGSIDLFKTLGAPYSLDFNNTGYFNASQQPSTRTIASSIPAIAYGTDNNVSNPFHTAGGATWDNIIETGSGFILSSSTPFTGSIESAVIDQGASKTINNIQFNWSTNDANQGVISYYTSSDTIQNYQLRYGDVADLSSEEYKLFPLNDIPYLDANGSGSGDIDFITGSVNSITARYLQFKLTLRNNWNG